MNWKYESLRLRFWNTGNLQILGQSGLSCWHSWVTNFDYSVEFIRGSSAYMVNTSLVVSFSFAQKLATHVVYVYDRWCTTKIILCGNPWPLKCDMQPVKMKRKPVMKFYSLPVFQPVSNLPYGYLQAVDYRNTGWTNLHFGFKFYFFTDG